MKLTFNDKTILRSIVLSNLQKEWNYLKAKLIDAFTLTEGQLKYAQNVYELNKPNSKSK